VGRPGRRWLAKVDLPVVEREIIEDLCGLLDAMQMPIARLELKKILVDRRNCDSASSTPGRRGADAQPLELVEESMFARVGATVPSAIPAGRG
jgi:hypothetical protein